MAENLMGFWVRQLGFKHQELLELQLHVQNYRLKALLRRQERANIAGRT
jgi:hypothetical protein